MSSVNSPTTILVAPFSRDLGGNMANYESSQKPMAGGKRARKSKRRSSNKRRSVNKKSSKKSTMKRWFNWM